jgi:hypothetical protein
VCKAFEPHALACHITSSDLHPRSFPLAGARNCAHCP